MTEVFTYISDLLQSNMYLIRKNKRIIIIDPFISNKAIEYIKQNDLNIDFIILTHEHYDHISGINYFRENFQTNVICNVSSAKGISNPAINLSRYFDVLAHCYPPDMVNNNFYNIEDFYSRADIVFNSTLTLNWENNTILLYSTPGHTEGSICLKLNNEFLFTGDTLIKDHETITKFKTGSSKKFKELTIPFLNSLDKNLKVYPGHLDPFILKNHKYFS